MTLELHRPDFDNGVPFFTQPCGLNINGNNRLHNPCISLSNQANRSCSKQFSFQIKYSFLLTEVEQVYHNFLEPLPSRKVAETRQGSHFPMNRYTTHSSNCATG